MVLVKVVQLVVNVDGLGNITVDVNLFFANKWWSSTLVVLIDDTLNFFTHHVEGDAKGEKDHTKDSKDDHRGAKGRHWSPGWEHLLLELALLQFLNLFLDAHQIFFRDFHFLLLFTK